MTSLFSFNGASVKLTQIIASSDAFLPSLSNWFPRGYEKECCRRGSVVSERASHSCCDNYVCGAVQVRLQRNDLQGLRRSAATYLLQRSNTVVIHVRAEQMDIYIIHKNDNTAKNTRCRFPCLTLYRSQFGNMSFLTAL